MTVPPPIVKARFVDLETQNNVYSGLTATLKDMRTKMNIALFYPLTGDVDTAIVTIARKDGSERGKQYDLNVGQNVIGHSSDDTAHIKHAFEMNVPYTVKIGVDLYSGDKYVSVFSHGAESNEPSYSEFIYRHPENLDKFSDDATQFKLVDHEYYQDGGTIKMNCPIDYKEPQLDDRKPISVGFSFDEVDNYPGTANDSDNTEQTAAYITVPYQDDGQYEFLVDDVRGRLNNDSVYNVSVIAKYADGHQIQKTLDDNVHLIKNPLIVVEPYGLGSDGTGAGDVNTSTAAVLYVQKDTIGVTASNIPAQDSFTLKFSQDEEDKYTAQLNVSDGIITTRNFDGGNKEYLMYPVLNSGLTEVGTPITGPGGTLYDAQIFASYNTLPGTSIATLEKPSNVMSGTYVNDYTPLAQVVVANAWMAATDVVNDGDDGDREVNMTDATTINGYAVAPDIGIVGSFYKTVHFGAKQGFLQNLDVATTMFKYEISVTNGDEEENWQPVRKIRQIQGTASKTSQQNYMDVMDVINAPEQANNVGEYANIQYTGTAGTSGPLQPPIYFSISETVLSDVVFSEDQLVKVRVTIVTPDKSTDVGSKESNVSAVVKKITRYTMTAATASEPLFTGSGAEGVLAIPINAEGLGGADGADLNFASARFESNLAGVNADITQTDAEDADQNEGDVPDDDDDHEFNLIVRNPSKRGVGLANAINYTVTYKINDPNGGTVSIKSASYAINVTDEPTSNNYSVTNYSYKTFNNEGESGFVFDVSFTGADGVNVYFQSTNEDDDDDNDIERLLVLNVPRTNGDSQSNLSVMLQDTPASNSDASSSIKVNDINGNDSDPWLNYRSGTISFVPYKSRRVFGSIINDDDQMESNDPLVVDEKPILNIPVIDMPENVQLVGGVVESYDGTQLTWSNDLSDDFDATYLQSSYDLVADGVNKSGEVVVDVDDSSKRSYFVDVTDPLHAFSFELRTKLVSTVDSKVYYSKPVTVEFTSASVDLSDATVDVRRGSNVTTLKALINAYDKTDASDLATPTGVRVFAEPNFAGASMLLTSGVYTSTTFNAQQVYSINSIRIPNGFTVEVWEFWGGGTDSPDAVYTSDVPLTSSQITRVNVTGSATPKPSNLIVDELKLVDNAGVNACVSRQSGQQTLLTDAQIDGVIADSSRSIISDDPEVDGWSVKNTYADGATRPKVNLYYYGNAVAASVPPPAPNGDGLNASNSFTLSQAAGLGLYAIFYQNQGAKEYPFFNAYTAKTTSGTNKSWYKSKVFYGSESDQGDTTTDSNKAGLTLVYTGTDNGLLFPEITRRVKYVVKVGSNLTNANVPGYENEPVWLLSLQTSGAATSSSESFNFRLLETGMFTSHSSFGQLSLTFNVMLDPVRVKVLPCSSTNADVQEVGGDIHTYNLSQDYEKSDTLHLLVRMKAGVDYTEKRGGAAAEDKESESTYLSLVPEAKMPYTCAGKPSVDVVGTSSIRSGDTPDRRAINLKIDANGLEGEGVKSVIVKLYKEGDLTDPVAISDAIEVSVSFESTSEGLTSYAVGGNATLSPTDNMMPNESQHLSLDDETPVGSPSEYFLKLGTLDENDASILYLPADSPFESGEIAVLAVVATRVGTDVDYDTVTHPVSPDPLLSANTFQNNSNKIEFVLTHSGQSWSPLSSDLVLEWDDNNDNNGGGFDEVDYSVTKLTETTYKFSFIGSSNYPIRVELSKDGSSIPYFDNWLSPS